MWHKLRTAAGLVGLCTVVSLALSQAPAWAEGTVVSVTPAIGDTLTMQPGTVALTFDTAVGIIDATTTLSVIGPDYKHYETSCPTSIGTALSTTVLLGAKGTYTVQWLIAADNTRAQALEGSYSFQWTPAATTLIGEGTSTGPFCGIVSANSAAENSSTAPSTNSAVLATGIAGSQGSQETQPATSGTEKSASASTPWTAYGIGAAIVAGMLAAAIILLVRKRSRRRHSVE